MSSVALRTSVLNNCKVPHLSGSGHGVWAAEDCGQWEGGGQHGDGLLQGHGGLAAAVPGGEAGGVQGLLGRVLVPVQEHLLKPEHIQLHDVSRGHGHQNCWRGGL